MTDQLVEKIRLLEIHDVTGLRQDHQSRSDECVFQEKTRFDTSLVFVTDDDQRRHLQLPDVPLEIVKRRARALKSARHVRRALRIMFGELAGEFGKAERILDLECDATGAPTVGLRYDGRAFLFELSGEVPRALVKIFGVPALASRTCTGENERLHAPWMIERNLQRGIAPHGQADEVRAVDLQVIEHGDRVSHDVHVGVSRWVARHVGRSVAARRVGDAAIAPAELAQLRFPAAMVAGELVYEQNRRALTDLLVIE